MITSELLRIRYSLTSKILLTLVLLEALLVGLLLADLPSLIDGVIALNEVIPNATNADQFSDEQLAALTLASSPFQVLISDVLGNTGIGTSLPVIAATLFGALTITGEFRRGSVTNAALHQPLRAKLILTKATAIAATAFAAAIVLIVVRGGVLAIGLAVQGEPLLIEMPELLTVWARGIIALLAYSLLGLGLGLLVRNQVATVSVIFAVIVGESILRPLALLIFGGINPTLYLPFGLVPDIIGSNPLAVLGTSASLTASLSSLVALVTLTLWAGAVVGLAVFRFARTDIPSST
ncbi:MAG: hypothetical protein L0K44_03875 [Yaniella sp.]|nr:hypothetical protein [Yaniella sp.]